MKMRSVVLLILALVATPTGAGEPVALRVSPMVSFEPADLTVRATVAANMDNRLLEVVAESDGYYRSSQLQLDGANAPRTTLVSFRGLPEGSYTVRVVVRGSRGQALASNETPARVVSRGMR